MAVLPVEFEVAPLGYAVLELFPCTSGFFLIRYSCLNHIRDLAVIRDLVQVCRVAAHATLYGLLTPPILILITVTCFAYRDPSDSWSVNNALGY